MKFNKILSKVLLAGSFFMSWHSAIAAEFTCPTPESLKDFKGFYIEYPISMDVQTMQPYNWMVAKLGHKENERVVSSFLITPIVTADNEYPNDAALKMLDNFDSQADYKDCERITKSLELCGCIFLNKNDGSILTFMRANYAKNEPIDPENNIKFSAKMMQKFYRIKNNVK